jgi:hypothetical protein
MTHTYRGYETKRKDQNDSKKLFTNDRRAKNQTPTPGLSIDDRATRIARASKKAHGAANADFVPRRSTTQNFFFGNEAVRAATETGASIA